MRSTKSAHPLLGIDTTEEFHCPIRRNQLLQGGTVMKWEAPSFVEVKMDAEINSYQDDFRDIPDVQKESVEAPVTTIPQE